MRIGAVFEKFSDQLAGNAVGRIVSNAQSRAMLTVNEPLVPEDILVDDRRPDYLPAINGREILEIEGQIEVNLNALNSGKIGLLEHVY